MKTILLAAAFGLVAASALLPTRAEAEGMTCKASATDKKLAGAAQTSFIKKCETDATTACGATATERKLVGAARRSFTKKCVSDAVG